MKPKQFRRQHHPVGVSLQFRAAVDFTAAG
jgi:hypothetical protein